MSNILISTDDLQQRFAQDHAALFQLIGHEVACCEGVGTLEQVFSDRAVVRLDSGNAVTIDPDPDCIFLTEKPTLTPARADEHPEAEGPFVATDEDSPGNFFNSEMAS